MKNAVASMIALFLIFGMICLGLAEQSPQAPSSIKVKSKSLKDARPVPGPFKVQYVKFETIAINNQTHLAAAVVFNRDIDPSSVQQNGNVRLLKQDPSLFWVDASTQNNTVNIRPNFITWVCGAPLDSGLYRMHLRGTIKSADGVFLDCNGDGIGEGGNLPAYESQIFQASTIQLQEKEP